MPTSFSCGGCSHAAQNLIPGGAELARLVFHWILPLVTHHHRQHPLVYIDPCYAAIA